jgi:hypothetical protein
VIRRPAIETILAILRAGKAFVLRADEKLTAFVELDGDSLLRAELHFLTKPALATQFAP